MTEQNSKEIGFTGKVQVNMETDSGIYYRLQIPKNTVESLGLDKESLVSLELCNMSGECVECSRKVQAASGSQLRVNLPKKVTDELDVEKGDLLDTWIQKK